VSGVAGEDQTVVKPVMLIDNCSPNLLQAVSGETVNETRALTMLGCGSLGSKMTLHLAKSGCYSFDLVDKEYFSSHNNARHGLIVQSLDSLGTSKSQLLSDELERLGLISTWTKDDISMLSDKKQAAMGKRSDLVIDTTASLATSYFLAHQAQFSAAQVAQCTLYGASSMGVLAFEGVNRSVRVDDFASYLDTLCIEDKRIQQAMYGGVTPTVHQFGEGCSSLTTVMNDMDISLLTSSMSSILHKHISATSDAENGVIQVGLLDKESNNLSWRKYTLLPTKVIEADVSNEWDIRIIGNVVAKIKSKSMKNPAIETGGLLIGHFCRLSNTVYITDEIEPPTKPYQSSTRYDISTDGLPELFENIHRCTNGQITFIGTWHSHTSPTPPSELDKQTLANLQSNHDFPIVMLVQIGNNLERVIC
jgi:hypothetical protein